MSTKRDRIEILKRVNVQGKHTLRLFKGRQNYTALVILMTEINKLRIMDGLEPLKIPTN